MIEFLLHYYSKITIIVELIPLLIGVFTFKKFKQTPIVYFILFLFYTVLVENIGSSIAIVFREGEIFEDYGHLRKYRFFASNFWWFGIFWTIGSVLFWSFFYQKIISNERYRKILNVSTYFFLIMVSIYTLFNIDLFFKNVLSFNKILGSIVILMAIVFYFLDVLQSDIILTFYKSIYFYISIALFFWWIVTMPPYFYQRFVTIKNLELFNVLKLIRLTSNVFMYTTFALALLLCKPENPLRV